VAVDRQEFRAYFASHYARLCWLGYLLSGSRAEAEELAQDALVRTYNRRARVRRPNDPAAYARKVLVNRHRRRARPGRRLVGAATRSSAVPEESPLSQPRNALDRLCWWS